MIKQYGADAVRWFILSDSPPDKDIQWSSTGVDSANKFLQKIWNLNYSIFKRKNKTRSKDIEKKLSSQINEFVIKIDESINDFRFNVSIAYFYQIYKIMKDAIELEVSNEVLKESIIKIMKLMTPFTPHLAFECLELFNCNTTDKWPIIDKKNISMNIKLAVQINGKTRDVISIQKDLDQKTSIFLY